MNYGYGTVMLSGINLVSPQSGLQIFCYMGFAALTSRLVTIWLLEIWPEVAVMDKSFELRPLPMVGKKALSSISESKRNLLGP